MEMGQTSAAQILRAARLRAHLSQTELARRARIAQSVISAYESGRREPSFSTLTRMVNSTGHDVNVLLVDRQEVIRGIPNTPRGRRLRKNRVAILRLAERYGANNLRVFGSVARGEDTADSDIDIVADFPSGISLFELGDFKLQLSRILNTKVDLVPSDGLRPHVRLDIQREGIPL